MSPTVSTTHARILTVIPSPTEEAAVKKQQEEAVEKKRQEEAAAERKKLEEEAAANTNVSLDGETINVVSTHEAAVRLTCAGADKCSGTLTLATKKARKGKKATAVMVTIGTADFSISAGETGTVEIRLDAIGRVLLGAGHGRLNASMTVVKSSPAPSRTQIENVHLTQQKAIKTKK